MGAADDAAGGRSSAHGPRWTARLVSASWPQHGRSWSCGGFSSCRRCAHGRLAQQFATRQAVDALRVGRKLNGGRRKAATVVLQWTLPAAAAGGRRQHACLPGDGCGRRPRQRAAVERSCDFHSANVAAATRALRVRDASNGSAKPCTVGRHKKPRCSGLFLNTIMRPRTGGFPFGFAFDISG